jgi:hypothetical protein
MRLSTRRVKSVLAVFAMLVVLMVSAASPAMASHDNDGWRDNCEWVAVGWHWIPSWWGWDWDWDWIFVCNPGDNRWDNHNNHHNRHHDDWGNNPWWW